MDSELRMVAMMRRCEIDENVYMGSIIFPFQVKILSASGIKAVVNICDEYTGPLQAYKDSNIQQLYIPTVDL